MKKSLAEGQRIAHSEISGRILDATADCISKFGNRRTSVGDIAASSGLSRATIYNHFKNRNAITTALMRRELSRMQESIGSDISESTSPKERIVDCVALFVLSIRSNKLFRRMLELEPDLVLPWFTTRSGFLARSGTQLFSPYLRSAIEQGAISDRCTEEVSEWLTMVVLGFVFAMDTFPHFRDRDIRDLVRNLVLNGIA